jgi:hypothetical protein
MARPIGAQNKDKPYRDALRMAIAEAGDNFKTLREVAAAHVEKAKAGDINAIRELADRLDGKVPQAVVGDDEHGPIEHVIRWADDAPPQNDDASQQSAPIGGQNVEPPKT